VWGDCVLKAKDFKVKYMYESELLLDNRPFPHSASVRTNNSTRARLGWTFSYRCCIFVHPDLDSVPLFAGMWERSIMSILKSILNLV